MKTDVIVTRVPNSSWVRCEQLDEGALDSARILAIALLVHSQSHIVAFNAQWLRQRTVTRFIENLGMFIFYYMIVYNIQLEWDSCKIVHLSQLVQLVLQLLRLRDDRDVTLSKSLKPTNEFLHSAKCHASLLNYNNHRRSLWNYWNHCGYCKI